MLSRYLSDLSAIEREGQAESEQGVALAVLSAGDMVCVYVYTYLCMCVCVCLHVC